MSSNTNSSKREPHLINSSVVFVPQGMLIQDAVQEMIDKNISSLLVTDEKEHIVGILTERDIVRKFTLVPVEDKLTRTVSTIMTRPVQFVQTKDLHRQIVRLHLEKRIRHFPVLAGTEPKRENLLGIVSITDVARNYMLAEQGTKPAEIESRSTTKPELGVMASSRHLVNAYIQIFNNLGFTSQEIPDIGKFAGDPASSTRTIVLDLDGYTDQQTQSLIPVAVKSKGFLILTTSQPQLISIFKRYLDAEHQEIAMKPLDISYISWLLQRKWHVK